MVSTFSFIFSSNEWCSLIGRLLLSRGAGVARGVEVSVNRSKNWPSSAEDAPGTKLRTAEGVGQSNWANSQRTPGARSVNTVKMEDGEMNFCLFRVLFRRMRIGRSESSFRASPDDYDFMIIEKSIFTLIYKIFRSLKIWLQTGIR